MPYVISDTDFVFPYEIPLLKDMNAKASAEVNALIDEKCRLLLRRVLGIQNFIEFSGYLVDGLLPDPPTLVPQKWVDFVEGVENYELESTLYSYAGLKRILVKYVYYYWLEMSVSYLSGVGAVNAEAKNANKHNPTQELTKTWLAFMQDYQGSYRYGTPVGNVYHVGVPQIDGYYVGYPFLDTEASLVQYLSQFPTEYPDCELSPLNYEGITNQLGI